MIISRTPFRISFFGGGTDYPGFYNEHGGCTLSTSINQYCYVLIHPISHCFKYNFKASYAKTETTDKVSEFRHPLIRETLLYMEITDGLEVDHVSDLPGRTGLGSSSSFTVALLNALYCIKGEKASALKLADTAIHIERDLVGDPGGHQDQFAAAFGGLNRIDYTRNNIQVAKLNLSNGRLEDLQNHLMLFYLGLARSSNPILKDQEQRTDKNLQALLAMKEIADQACNILTSDQDLKAFGKLLNETWKLKKSLSARISNPTVDQAYSAALKAGAWGGKLLGAGGGGFLMFLAEPGNHPKIVKALSELHQVPVAFESVGATILYSTEDS